MAKSRQVARLLYFGAAEYIEIFTLTDVIHEDIGKGFMVGMVVAKRSEMQLEKLSIVFKIFSTEIVEP